MFNAHIVHYCLTKWQHHSKLAIQTRGAERQLHNRNSTFWGQRYIDEYPNDFGVINATGAGLPQDDHGQRP